MLKKFLNNNTNISIFIIYFIAFIFTSFAIKNFLISNYNNKDFFLISIDYIKNYGAAFSLFNTHTNLLVIVSAIILAAIIVYIVKNIKNFSKIDIVYTAMLCSGIICNMTERIIDGFVTDYIKLNFVTFPIFNISDIFISIGAFMIICTILFNNEQ